MAKVRIDPFVEGNLVKHNHGVDDLLPEIDDRYVNSTGDTMTGGLTLPTLKTNSLSVAIVTKTSNYTVTDNDNVVLVDGTLGAVIINLPSASGRAGRIYTIKKIDASLNIVTVNPNLTETIDGSLTYILSSQWKYVSVVSNGDNAWYIIANN